MFSGLEAQSEMNRLLDEIYGNPDRASLGGTKRCSKTPETNRRPEGIARCTALRRSVRDSQAEVEA